MRTDRGFDRLITFADAVVAIALTLLVLPLVDIPRELEETGLGALLHAHRDELLSFFIGFMVIFALWRVHHRTMEYFRAYDRVLMVLTQFWLFTIVVLPFATQLLNTDDYDRGAVPFYDGVLLASALCLLGMSWRGRRHRELLAEGPEVDRWVDEPLSLVTAAILLVSLGLAIVVPSVGAYPLLALVLDDTISRRLFRLRRRSRQGQGDRQSRRDR